MHGSNSIVPLVPNFPWYRDYASDYGINDTTLKIFYFMIVMGSVFYKTWKTKTEQNYATEYLRIGY
jgi:hypothetical protein